MCNNKYQACAAAKQYNQNYPSLFICFSRNLALGLYPSSTVFSLKKTFRKLALPPSSGKKGGRGGTYSVGSVRKSFPPPFFPEDGSRTSFRNVVFKEKLWTMDKVLKQDSLKYITPSSEPFRICLFAVA
jgi:hypothetical protein